MQPHFYLTALCCAITAFSTLATPLNTATNIERQTNQHAINTQQQIDKLDNIIQKNQKDIKTLRQQIADLALYQQHLKSVIENQEQQKSQLEAQMQQVDQTKQALIPLLYRMLDSLARWQQQDLPFNQTERQARIIRLQQMLADTALTDSEKLQQMLDAYLIEHQYGSQLAHYQQKIQLAGVEREVELLQFGRISLLARNLTHDSYWLFTDSQQWQLLDKNDYSTLEQAFEVANKQTSALIRLPLSVGITPANVEVIKNKPINKADTQAQIEQHPLNLAQDITTPPLTPTDPQPTLSMPATKQKDPIQ